MSATADFCDDFVEKACESIAKGVPVREKNQRNDRYDNDILNRRRPILASKKLLSLDAKFKYQLKEHKTSPYARLAPYHDTTQ